MANSNSKTSLTSEPSLVNCCVIVSVLDMETALGILFPTNWYVYIHTVLSK